MNEFRKTIWNTTIEDVLQVAKLLFEDTMMEKSEEDRRRIGGRGNSKAAPQPHRLYLRRIDQRRTTPMELLRHFFTIDEHVHLPNRIFIQFSCPIYSVSSIKKSSKFWNTFFRSESPSFHESFTVDHG